MDDTTNGMEEKPEGMPAAEGHEDAAAKPAWEDKPAEGSEEKPAEGGDAAM